MIKGQVQVTSSKEQYLKVLLLFSHEVFKYDLWSLEVELDAPI